MPKQIKTAAFSVVLLAALGSTTVRAQVSFSTPSDRLSGLSLADLAEYRDLAEELSEIQNRGARNLSVRLYLIGAFHSTGALRRSCLRGLVDVARTEQERDQLRILAYLTDPYFADWITKAGNQKDPRQRLDGETGIETTPKTKLLDALLSIRQGKPLRAKKILEDPQVQQLFSKFEAQMKIGDLMRACNQAEISDATLARLLSIDLELRFGEVPENRLKDRAQWSALFKGTLPGRLQAITMGTITEFDPTKSTYRNGIWQKPLK